MTRRGRRWPLFALAAAAPDPTAAWARAPAGDALPDVEAEAGRDLTALHRILNSGRSEMDPHPADDGRQAFGRFVESLRAATGTDAALAAELAGPPARWKADVRELVFRGYCTRVHGAALRDTLAAAVSLKTVVGPGATAAADPGLVAFGDWLIQTAASFGLKARPAPGGDGWEVAVGNGKRTVALVTHVDVEDTDPALWPRDPWAGTVVDRAIHGRGAQGGKAGLVAALYALRVLADADVPLRSAVKLFVGVRHTSDRRDAAAWIKKAGKLDAALVLGVPFPPTRGESGVARVHVRSAPGDEPDAAAEGWAVISLAATSPPHGIPVEATAVLDARGLDGRRALGTLRRTLGQMQRDLPDSDGEFAQEGAYLKVVFRGRPTDSATPEAGVNALADLARFLADYVGVFPDHRGRLVRFLAAYVAGDTGGARLGVQGVHPDMPPATVAPVRFGEGERGPELTLDVRWPVGRTTAEVHRAVRDRAQELTGQHGGVMEVSVEGTDPVLLPADDPALRVLRGVYRDLLRRDPVPRALPWPTYARAVPGAIGFGPAPEGRPLHPGPGESMGIEDLEIATRLVLTALLRLCVGP